MEGYYHVFLVSSIAVCYNTLTMKKGVLSMRLLDFFKHNANKDENVKKCEIEDPVARFYTDYDLSNIKKHIDEIADTLNVSIPEYHFVHYIFDDGINVQLSDTYLPEFSNNYMLAYKFDDGGKILLGIHIPVAGGRLLSEGEMLFTFAHELRHVWQEQYEHDRYYGKPNAVHAEVIMDNAEIDADAFAYAYLDRKTGFKKSDYMNDATNHVFKVDNSSRKKRAKLLADLYFPRH